MDLARNYLRSHCDALIAIGEGTVNRRLDRVRYVIDPVSGAPVIAACKGLHEEPELVLHVPEDGDHCLHLLVTAHPLEDCAEVDRYLICLGAPRDKSSSTYYLLTPGWAKFGRELLSAEDIVSPNPWAALQGKLCSAVNKDPEKLAKLTAATGLPADTPTKLVGVDPLGFDLRAPYGLARGPADIANALYDGYMQGGKNAHAANRGV
jgi:hypothetical protein